MLILALKSLNLISSSNIKTLHILNWVLKSSNHNTKPKFLNQIKKPYKNSYFKHNNKKTLYNKRYFSADEDKNLKLILKLADIKLDNKQSK